MRIGHRRRHRRRRSRSSPAFPPFRRVVVETTGLADPAPILATLLSEPVVRHHYEPERVIASVARDPTLQTDTLSSGLLDFGRGRQLAFTVSTQAARYQRIQLVGTQGRIEIEIPVNAPQDKACRYVVDDAVGLDGSGCRIVTLPVADQYQLQAEAFSRAVRSEVPTAAGLDDAVMNMRIIDALFASEKSGRFEAVRSSIAPPRTT